MSQSNRQSQQLLDSWKDLTTKTLKQATSPFSEKSLTEHKYITNNAFYISDLHKRHQSLEHGWFIKNVRHITKYKKLNFLIQLKC